MRILYMGLTGDDVLAWQTFLRGFIQTSQIVLNSTFDQVTLDATKMFQRASACTSDGIVGPGTMAAAMRLGYSQMTDERSDLDKKSGNWPVKHDDAVALTTQQIESMFGKFSYVPSPTAINPEQITITDSWDQKNIVTVKIPELQYVTSGHNSIQCHTAIANQMKKVFSDWDAEYLSTSILTWGGSWASRFKRGSRTSLSNHAWGTAFDINVQWNALGVRPALVGQTGCVRELVEIAYNNGFFWGGHFNSRLDGMHFEAFKII